jgi:hypothetical protein
MKLGLSICAGLFVVGVLLALGQMWWSPWSPAVFMKLEMSVGGLLLIAGVVWFVVKEYRADKATKRGDLDGP